MSTDVAGVVKQLEAIAVDAERVFGNLSPTQLNWKPSAQSDINSSIINDFVGQQTTIAEKMQATANLDPERIVITSPAAAVVTYSLMDAYRIIAVHERRHFQQAQRVTEESGFPT
jgi:hypothetical protein